MLVELIAVRSCMAHTQFCACDFAAFVVFALICKCCLLIAILSVGRHCARKNSILS